MNKRLCIDVGNTRIKIAIFEGNDLIFSWVTSLFNVQAVLKISKTYGVTSCAICQSGILSDDIIKSITSNIKKTIILSHLTPVPITNLYKTPQTLGKDRLASAVACTVLYPNQDCVFINAGTCITMDFIDKLKQYHGGNISPGINMRLKSMHKFTARLPLVLSSFNKKLMGQTTEEALQNGAVKGAIYEVESFLNHLSEEYGRPKVIIAGGDAYFFENHGNFKIFACPNLVLVGLNEILNFNGF